MKLTRPQIKILREARGGPIPIAVPGKPLLDVAGLPIQRPMWVNTVIKSLIKKKYLHPTTGAITDSGRVALLVDPQASSELEE